MRFDQHGLQQLTPDYISKLPSQRKEILIEELRQDLIAAHDRLNQNSTNSSRPPSSQAPWARSKNPNDQDKNNAHADQGIEESSSSPHDSEDSVASTEEGVQTTQSANESLKEKTLNAHRKQGKQPGAKGFGRVEKLTVTHIEIHRAELCQGCGCSLPNEALFEATGGYYVIDLDPSSPGVIGIKGTYTKHIFGKTHCNCGFSTQTKPHKCPSDEKWTVEMGEWRLIGPNLMSFIVFAKLRLHLTIGKTRLLLKQWVGISLSEGAISAALKEAGRAAEHLEPELLAALKASSILYVDETSWKEHQVTRWLWVAVGDEVVYFTVGPRSAETAKKILNDSSATLMTDGYAAYRFFNNRVRCWAHLKRKAKGLSESWNTEVATFGHFALKAWNLLIKLVYKMRELPKDQRQLTQKAALRIETIFLYRCIKRQDASHEATRAFCREVINDPEAIFLTLRKPDLPLTNNAAERALRPMVIMRKISYGSKTEEGSRALALMASIEATMTKRGLNSCQFYQHLIKACRSGQPPPRLVPS
jgi:transposase